MTASAFLKADRICSASRWLSTAS